MQSVACGLIQNLLAPAGNGHDRAVVSQRAGDRKTDARAASGDQRMSALQHGCSSLKP